MSGGTICTGGHLALRQRLIYLLLPFADLLVRRDAGMTAAMENSVVLVVEPLTFLVEDQIKRAIYISNYGKRAAVTTLCNSDVTVITVL